MDYITDSLDSIMRTIASSLNYPVIAVLIILVAAVIVILGTLIVEIFTEHRRLKVKMPQLVDSIRNSSSAEEVAAVINKSGLLKSQKRILLELQKHPGLSFDQHQAMADRLVEEEQSKYELRVLITDLISKLGPMFGLLGTLIPLGPGIIALGQGNTYTLSQSLMTAFDTTILGLITAAFAMVISTIRKRWYANYMSVLETLVDCMLYAPYEREKDDTIPVIDPSLDYEDWPCDDNDVTEEPEGTEDEQKI
jgi:biopolymer transport protein ExbB/TolQ